jgi:hypothetical protein
LEKHKHLGLARCLEKSLKKVWKKGGAGVWKSINMDGKLW